MYVTLFITPIFWYVLILYHGGIVIFIWILTVLNISVDPFCGGPGESFFFSSLHFFFEIRGAPFLPEIGCMGMAGAMLVVEKLCWLMEE